MHGRSSAVQPSWRRRWVQHLCASMGAASQSPILKTSNDRRRHRRRRRNRRVSMSRAPRRRRAIGRLHGTGERRPEELGSLRPRTFQRWMPPFPRCSRRLRSSRQWSSTLKFKRRPMPMRTLRDPPQARRPRARSSRRAPLSMQPLAWSRPLAEPSLGAPHACSPLPSPPSRPPDPSCEPQLGGTG